MLDNDQIALILSVLRKADKSHRNFTLLVSLQVEALVSVLEKANPDLHAEYTRTLYQLSQDHRKEFERDDRLKAFFDEWSHQ